MAEPQSAPFSSTVQLTLEIDGLSLPVAKSAPDRITLVTPTTLPPGEAVLRFVIDGREHRREVILPRGRSADSPFVRVESPTAVRGA